MAGPIPRSTTRAALPHVRRAPDGRHGPPDDPLGRPTVMHRPARPVTSYDEELRSLVADMVATMYAADGVGLAACQIGVDLAVFVFDCPDDDGTVHRGVVCNPVARAARGPRPAARRGRGGLPVLPRRVRRLRPARLRPRRPARAWTARTSPTRATACSRAASSTRPTTPTARCSATGSATGREEAAQADGGGRRGLPRAAGRSAPRTRRTPDPGSSRGGSDGSDTPGADPVRCSGRLQRASVSRQLDLDGRPDTDLALDVTVPCCCWTTSSRTLARPRPVPAVVLGHPAADELVEDGVHVIRVDAAPLVGDRELRPGRARSAEARPRR